MISTIGVAFNIAIYKNIFMTFSFLWYNEFIQYYVYRDL